MTGHEGSNQGLPAGAAILHHETLVVWREAEQEKLKVSVFSSFKLTLSLFWSWKIIYFPTETKRDRRVSRRRRSIFDEDTKHFQKASVLIQSWYYNIIVLKVLFNAFSVLFIASILYISCAWRLIEHEFDLFQRKENKYFRKGVFAGIENVWQLLIWMCCVDS